MNIKRGFSSDWLGQPSDGLLTDLQWEGVARAGKLSPREAEVAKLLFQGHTRQQIAEFLQIKPRTVRQHTESLHDKLNVTSRVGVVLRIIQIRDHLSSRRKSQNGVSHDGHFPLRAS
ncbi:MAG: helix-turn-helix transcriptional regulator [Planctomycetota bacterium]